MNGLTGLAHDLASAAVAIPHTASDVIHESILAIEQAAPPGSAVNIQSSLTDGAAYISGPLATNVRDVAASAEQRLASAAVDLLKRGRS
jgi:hypothetical protein